MSSNGCALSLGRGRNAFLKSVNSSEKMVSAAERGAGGLMVPEIEEFVKFWQELDTAAAPFVHPADVGCLQGSSLDCSLLPVPAVGDIRGPDVLVLMLNPGREQEDFSWEERPEFRRTLERNLRQDLEGVAYPFFYLDPRYEEHPGAAYWFGGGPQLRVAADECGS